MTRLKTRSSRYAESESAEPLSFRHSRESGNPEDIVEAAGGRFFHEEPHRGGGL